MKDFEFSLSRVKELVAKFRALFQKQPISREMIPLAWIGRVPNLVDTDNFFYYLMGAKNLVGPGAVFAERLSLRSYTPFLKEMYDTETEGYYYRIEERKELHDLAKKSQRRYGKGNELTELYEQFANHKDIAERAREIYANPRGHAIKATIIVSGEYTKVENVDPYRLYLFGRIPLIDAHTHPVDSLPSPSDYFPLIAKVVKAPIFRAIMVLCPSIQILAVSTARTPFLDPNKARKVIKDFQTIDEPYKERVATLESRIDKVIQHRSTKINNDFTNALQELEKVDHDFSEGRIPKEEYEIKLDEAKKALQPDSAYEQRFNRILEKAQKQYQLEGSAALNRGLMLFPRLYNIKLYSSTNMEDFYQFSA